MDSAAAAAYEATSKVIGENPMDRMKAVVSFCEVELGHDTLDRILGGLSENVPVCLVEFADPVTREPTFSCLGTGHSESVASPEAFGDIPELHQTANLGGAASFPDLPFRGGLVGFMPYQAQAQPALGQFLRTDRLIVRDHRSGRGLIIAYGLEQRQTSELRREFDQLAGPPRSSASRDATGAIHLGSEWRQSCGKETYVEAVHLAKGMIRDGALEQVIVSLQMSRQFRGPTFPIYRSLRGVNTAPQNFYLRFPSLTLLGTPPSSYLTIVNRRIMMDIGAGTRPMTGDTKTDDHVAAELAADPKEGREHELLVDEAAATLARIARKSTISVPVRMEVRRFSHVMHLFSVLTADLEEGRSPIEALAGALPPGPVVGVPTLAAADAITALESTPRGPYGGVYFMADFDGSLRSAIVERSMWISDNQIYLRVGAGITSESVPESEYAECLLKAKALMTAIERVTQ
jgi:anthranilate synthase component I